MMIFRDGKICSKHVGMGKKETFESEIGVVVTTRRPFVSGRPQTGQLQRRALSNVLSDVGFRRCLVI